MFEFCTTARFRHFGENSEKLQVDSRSATLSGNLHKQAFAQHDSLITSLRFGFRRGEGTLRRVSFGVMAAGISCR